MKKKISKIKFIEFGRVCTPEELDQIIGGGDKCDSNYITCRSGYMSCNEIGYKSCEPTSLAGYTSQGQDVFCASGHTYTQCSAGTPAYDTCPADHTYSTFE